MLASSICYLWKAQTKNAMISISLKHYTSYIFQDIYFKFSGNVPFVIKKNCSVKIKKIIINKHLMTKSSFYIQKSNFLIYFYSKLKKSYNKTFYYYIKIRLCKFENNCLKTVGDRFLVK